MTEQLTVATLLESQNNDLKLELCAGDEFTSRAFIHHSFDDDSSTLVGFFNLIHSNQAQIIGPEELYYLQKLNIDQRKYAYAKLFEKNTVALFFSDSIDPDWDIKEAARQYQTPVFKSSLKSNVLATRLRYYLTHQLADKTILHGVFMEVISLGVLLTGESGLGKSELALELITRGHRLIADDAPEFLRIAPDIIAGYCPSLLQGFLEVRGLGVLDIREMYGDSAIKFNKYLRLVIDLQPMVPNRTKQVDRLHYSHRTKNVLGLEIPVITLPVAPGRNLAVMVEAAVRNHLLVLKGYNAAEHFIEQQQQSLRENAQ